MDFNCQFYLLVCLLLSFVYLNVSLPNSKDWLIEFHQQIEPNEAKRIAKRYAMVSRGPVGRDKHLYHFVDLKPTHPLTRRKRDTIQEEFIQRHHLVIR